MTNGSPGRSGPPWTIATSVLIRAPGGRVPTNHVSGIGCQWSASGASKACGPTAVVPRAQPSATMSRAMRGTTRGTRGTDRRIGSSGSAESEAGRSAITWLRRPAPQ